jgi:8-oxo-dGTP pyrophosphatase MutT (NUDIX family)
VQGDDDLTMIQERRAARVLVVDGDRVLLFRGISLRDPSRPAWWITPGGGLEDGETERAAAVRELREETGLVVDEAMLEGPVHAEVIEFPTDAGICRQSQRYYLVRNGAFELDRSGQEAYELAALGEARWFGVDVLLDRFAHPDPSEIIYPANLGVFLAGWLRRDEREVG